MKVRAIKRGFTGGIYRRPGDEFDCPSDAFCPIWMIKLEKGVEPYEEPKDKYVPLEIPSLMNKEKKEEKKPENKEEKKPAKKNPAYKE